MVEEETEPLIIDIGSGTLKAGTASDDAPKTRIPMVYGKPKSKGIMVGLDQKPSYFGHEFLDKKKYLNEEKVVKNGVIQNVEAIKEIFDTLFSTVMQVDVSVKPVMLTEPPNNPGKIREQMAAMMFEEFKVPKLYLANSAVLSLFATGRTTGTVVDSGEGCTHSVPIYEGYAIPHAITEIPICGRDLTNWMHQLLKEKNADRLEDNTASLNTAIAIKEMFGKVCTDFDADLKAASEPNSGIERTYSLPGGNSIKVSSERLKCPELLFSFNLYDQKESDKNMTRNNRDDKEMDGGNEGIQRFTNDSIMKCENDIRKNLFQNIVLAGGCTMFEGMKDRMKKEIQALAASQMQPDVESPADRKYSAWLGGAILSLIGNFDKNGWWITKKEWEEEGSTSRIVQRRCF